MKLTFKCPGCHASMIYDESAGAFKCRSCRNEIKIDNHSSFENTVSPEIETHYYDDEEAREYICKKCSSTIMTDNRSAIDTCPFCGGQAVAGKRLSGTLRPSAIIPFNISKSEAIKSFHKWKRGLRLAQEDLNKKSLHVQLHKIYLPFWQFNASCDSDIKLYGDKSETVTENEETFVKKGLYDLYRKLSLSDNNLFVYASDTFSSKLTNAILPYDSTKSKSFSPNFLSETHSENYKCEYADSFSEATKRLKEDISAVALEQCSDFSNVKIDLSDDNFNMKSALYVLCPVWFAIIRRNDDDYIFLLNGQTGKLARTAPISRSKLLTTLFLFMASLFLVFRLITLFLGGPIL